MGRRRLQRLALQWGGLVLVAQLWVALIFVNVALDDWTRTKPFLVSFAESVNRFSQLRTPALKYPASGVYFVLFVAGLLTLLGWLVVRGLREAMAPEPEATDDDSEDQR
jgi:hypothetical protein